jgi:hypothetical protein
MFIAGSTSIVQILKGLYVYPGHKNIKSLQDLEKRP